MTANKTRLTDLNHPSAVNVLNKVLDNVDQRLDAVEQQAALHRISSVSTLQFGTIPANSCVETVVNLLGVSTKLVAHANPILSLGSNNLTWTAYVTAANQVHVRVCNPTTNPIVVNTVRWNILVN